MDIFLICGRNTARREAFISRITNEEINLHIIDAVYLEEYFSETSKISLPEQGCALAHLAAYAHMRKIDCDYGLIVEDDAILSPEIFKLDWHTVLAANSVVSFSRAKISMAEYRLSKWIYPLRKPRRHGNLLIGMPYKIEKKGACCYLITQDAARKIEQININAEYVADDWPEFSKHIDYSECRPLLGFENYQECGSEIEESRSGNSTYIKKVGVRKIIGRIIKGLWLRIVIFSRIDSHTSN